MSSTTHPSSSFEIVLPVVLVGGVLLCCCVGIGYALTRATKQRELRQEQEREAAESALATRQSMELSQPSRPPGGPTILEQPTAPPPPPYSRESESKSQPHAAAAPPMTYPPTTTMIDPRTGYPIAVPAGYNPQTHGTYAAYPGQPYTMSGGPTYAPASVTAGRGSGGGGHGLGSMAAAGLGGGLLGSMLGGVGSNIFGGSGFGSSLMEQQAHPVAEPIPAAAAPVADVNETDTEPYYDGTEFEGGDSTDGGDGGGGGDNDASGESYY